MGVGLPPAVPGGPASGGEGLALAAGPPAVAGCGVSAAFVAEVLDARSAARLRRRRPGRPCWLCSADATVAATFPWQRRASSAVGAAGGGGQPSSLPCSPSSSSLGPWAECSGRRTVLLAGLRWLAWTVLDCGVAVASCRHLSERQTKNFSAQGVAQTSGIIYADACGCAQPLASMDVGRRSMGDGRWSMDAGCWSTDDGRSLMDDGCWSMDDG